MIRHQIDEQAWYQVRDKLSNKALYSVMNQVKNHTNHIVGDSIVDPIDEDVVNKIRGLVSNILYNQLLYNKFK